MLGEERFNDASNPTLESVRLALTYILMYGTNEDKKNVYILIQKWLTKFFIPDQSDKKPLKIYMLISSFFQEIFIITGQIDKHFLFSLKAINISQTEKSMVVAKLLVLIQFYQQALDNHFNPSAKTRIFFEIDCLNHWHHENYGKNYIEKKSENIYIAGIPYEVYIKKSCNFPRDIYKALLNTQLSPLEFSSKIYDDARGIAKKLYHSISSQFNVSITDKISSLPAEILVEIFKYLDHRSFLQAASVSKTFFNTRQLCNIRIEKYIESINSDSTFKQLLTLKEKKPQKKFKLSIFFKPPKHNTFGTSNYDLIKEIEMALSFIMKQKDDELKFRIFIALQKLIARFDIFENDEKAPISILKGIFKQYFIFAGDFKVGFFFDLDYHSDFLAEKHKLKAFKFLLVLKKLYEKAFSNEFPERDNRILFEIDCINRYYKVTYPKSNFQGNFIERKEIGSTVTFLIKGIDFDAKIKEFLNHYSLAVKEYQINLLENSANNQLKNILTGFEQLMQAENTETKTLRTLR